MNFQGKGSHSQDRCLTCLCPRWALSCRLLLREGSFLHRKISFLPRPEQAVPFPASFPVSWKFLLLSCRLLCCLTSRSCLQQALQIWKIWPAHHCFQVLFCSFSAKKV